MPTRRSWSTPSLSLALVFVLGACGPPPAPDDLDALSRFLFASVGDELPTRRAEGLAKLEALLVPLNLSEGLEGRSWDVSGPRQADVAQLTWPEGRDPAECTGAGVARSSPWPTSDHALHQAQPEQLPGEPSASLYERTFLSDVECFKTRACALLKTENKITRENALLAVTFVNHKDFVWVPMDAAATRHAILSRGWVSQNWPGKDGKGEIHQSCSVDVFIGRADGTTIRYQVSWSQTSLPIIADKGLQLAVVSNSVDGILRAGDEYIRKTWHGGM